jgi:REP element-mobilizing transposase RayT
MLATHIIFGAFGFWLPNDPRGSWSDFVASWQLFRYGGKATKTTQTRSLADKPHDHQRRVGAKQLLTRPPVRFSGVQARAIAFGFGDYAARSQLAIFACAVMPDHVHLVLGSHRLAPKQLAIQLKAAATRRLMAENIHPFPISNGKQPKCFARGEWKVYLDTPDDVHRAVRYVEKNPEKEGLRRQHWSFITPFPAPRAPLPRRG